MTGTSRPAVSGAPARSTWILLFVELLLAVGLVARLRAAFMPAAEMLRSFPTEDGYLMLTVARNIALGLGMSTAAGTIPTNGVQPLSTFLQAACFFLAGGDRAAGVRILLVISTLLAGATAWLVYRLGRRILGDGEAALLGAAAWFASPGPLFHTMNMLETGLAMASVVAVLLVFSRDPPEAPAAPRLGWSLAVGGLLGAAFWARNDAVLLMAAVGLAHLILPRPGSGRRHRVAETAAMAVAAAAVSLPWLLHGWLRFGHLVPVSGRAYLGASRPAEALRWAAVALFEHVTLLASFENKPYQDSVLFGTLCGLAFLGLAAAGVRAVTRHLPRAGRHGTAPALAAAALHLAGLTIFYVAFFDAPWFIRRYLAPVTTVTALLWGAAAAWGWRRMERSPRRWLRGILPVAALLLLANFALRDGLFVEGPWRTGVFFRSVDWLEENVDEKVWLGAFQSGTLGFFHDRTINLDGKVNPEALRAIREGRLPRYVVDSPISYIVDWASLVAPWFRSEEIISRNFTWEIQDPHANFAVLKRRPRPDAERP